MASTMMRPCRLLLVRDVSMLMQLMPLPLERTTLKYILNRLRCPKRLLLLWDTCRSSSANEQ